MAYSQEDKDKILNTIFEKIEGGMSARKAVIEAKISSKTFWDWLDADGEKIKQYARACEARAEFIMDEIYDIVDATEADVYKDDEGNIKIDGNVVQRARLQSDIRKWHLSKLNPKKYGDKLDIEQSGEITISFKD